MTSFSFFSFPSVSLLSEIKDRGGEGSNREHVVFRHGDHGESSTCSRKGPTGSATGRFSIESRSFLLDSRRFTLDYFLRFISRGTGS